MTPFKFLIDECLSPELVPLAQQHGHFATCIRDMGWQGMKDWEITLKAFENDFTLVTNNSHDFRGDGIGRPGGHYAKQPIHAGLICIEAGDMSRAKQKQLFAIALQELTTLPDLINTALEIVEDENGEIECRTYGIPPTGR